MAADDKAVSIPLSSSLPQFPRSAPLPADSPSGFSASGQRPRRARSSSQTPLRPLFGSSPPSPTRRPCALRLSLRNAIASPCSRAYTMSFLSNTVTLSPLPIFSRSPGPTRKHFPFPPPAISPHPFHLTPFPP